MIQIEHLTKTYGRFTAVDDISFTARPGSVVGFLGPNGAGKSTAMRMMTDLTPPTSGSATVLGRRYRDLPNPGRQVGVMLDAAAQHPGRTGREVLRLASLQMGMPKTRVDEMLSLVGLTDDEASRRVRNYSLGMRQRLGLASALMGDPEVLILDEPANGLDPQGIHWMRGLLRHLADEGRTVLLSSHLLGEVQIIADEIVMIGRGRIVAQGPKEELLRAKGARVAAADNDALLEALVAAGIEAVAHGTVVIAQAPPGRIGEVALDARIPLVELGTQGQDGLEQMFLELTAATGRGPVTEEVAA
jgi:ABC-2 type transport system ATP-binding protein